MKKIAKYIILASIGIIAYGYFTAPPTPTNELADSKIRSQIVLVDKAKKSLKYPDTYKKVGFIASKSGDTLNSQLLYTGQNAFGVPVEMCVTGWLTLNEDGSINPNGGGDIEHGECKH